MFVKRQNLAANGKTPGERGPLDDSPCCPAVCVVIALVPLALLSEAGGEDDTGGGGNPRHSKARPMGRFAFKREFVGPALNILRATHLDFAESANKR